LNSFAPPGVDDSLWNSPASSKTKECLFNLRQDFPSTR
jgi:hypothetical protein